MSTDSPHLYRRRGQQLGRSDELLDTIAEVSARLQAQGVATVLTLGHLAHRTGVPHAYLRKIAARDIDPYHTFEIRRRAGKAPRLISSPGPTVMHVQRWILSRILDRVSPHQASFAYQRGKSIRLCAEQHLGARWLIKLDLHNFFHSIDERQVFGLFAGFGYPPLLALELARLCTRQAYGGFPHPTRFRIPHPQHAVISAYSTHALGFVPQGAPTSGALANLAAQPMDEVLTSLAHTHRLTYTRYADDMVLSGVGSFSRDLALSVLRATSREIAACGFAIHHRKTRLTPPGARRIVLGMLVDGDRVRLSKDTRNKISTHLHGADKYGLLAHQTARGFSSVLGLARHIDGLLAFAHDVDPSWAAAYRGRWQQILARDAPALGPFESADVFRSRNDYGLAPTTDAAGVPWD
jgi:RNA-directed DNA polymerase